ANQGLSKGKNSSNASSYPHLCITIANKQKQSQTIFKQQQTKTTNKMKKLIVIAAILTSAFAANAQNASSSATQTVNLALSNALEITFTGSTSATGTAVTLNFTTVNDYANGVTSAAQELKVRSNKNFTVAVKSNSANFTYSGTTSPAPTMPVSGVLGIKLSANATSGTVGSTFSTSAYNTLSATSADLITN